MSTDLTEPLGYPLESYTQMTKASVSSPPGLLEGVTDQEPMARKVAGIMGAASAAAQALIEYDRRRALGEDVIVFSTRGRWVVGPKEVIAASLQAQPRRARRVGTRVLR